MASRGDTAAAAGGVPHRLAVVVRPGDGLGFRLAGVRTLEVERGAEAGAFRELLAEADLGVAAVEEDVLRAAPERLLQRARARGVPVVLPFALPRRWGEEGLGRAYVAALIRRAVGYAVKLGGPGGPAGGEP